MTQTRVIHHREDRVLAQKHFKCDSSDGLYKINALLYLVTPLRHLSLSFNTRQNYYEMCKRT